MKNHVLLALLFITSVMMAQPGTAVQKNDRSKNKLSKEQRASLRSKKMTLALDLSEQQQTEVYTILLAEANNHPKEPITKKQRAQLTSEERFNRMQARLDAQIRVKRQLKQILTKAQYAKFEKMMDERSEKLKERTRNMRRKAPRPSR